MTCATAYAQAGGASTTTASPGSTVPVPSAQPYYTLEVDSNATDEISYEALAARIQSELGATVARASLATPTRAAIFIRWRTETKSLTVRAVHTGGPVLERTVETNGDSAATQREAVLLAGNLARDEARELLDELAARPPKTPPTPPAKEPEKKPDPEEERRAQAESAEDRADEAKSGFMPVTASLVYPVATNIKYPHVKTWLDLSVAYGHVGRVRGAQIGFGGVYASRNVVGVQLAGIFTASTGRVTGTQLSGGANVALGELRGAQTAGIANVVVGNVKGIQVAPGANVTVGIVRGAQLAAGANVATDRVDGLQVAAAANVTPQSLRGWQFTAGVNYAKDVVGAQIGNVNYTGDVTGGQLAIVNVGTDVTGVQFGLVNIGRKVKGVQLGLVNVAEEVDGAQLGLVGVTRTGVHPIIWLDSLNYFNVGFRFATKYVYTSLAFTLGSHENGLNSQGTTVAIGAHVPLPHKFDFDVEQAFSTITVDPDKAPKDTNSALHVRLLPGYSFSPRFRVFGGGGVRIPVDFAAGSKAVRPEFMAGVQF